MANILVPKLFGFAKKIVFTFSAPPFSVGERLHVTYKIMKKKKIYFFKYISSRELKTSEYSLVLREHSDVFNILDEIYLVFTLKK